MTLAWMIASGAVPYAKPVPKSVARVRNSRGRCYELAWRVMIEDGNMHWQLAHGNINGLPHAWVVCQDDATIYDPTANAWFSLAGYLPGAVVEHTYNQLECAKLAVETGHLGPWH